MRSLVVWVLRILGIATLVGLGSYLLIVGPENANWLNSVLGTVAALAALIVPYLWPAKAGGSDTEDSEPDRQDIEDVKVQGSLAQEKTGDSAKRAASSQSIKNARVKGDLTQSFTTKRKP